MTPLLGGNSTFSNRKDILSMARGLQFTAQRISKCVLIMIEPREKELFLMSILSSRSRFSNSIKSWRLSKTEMCFWWQLRLDLKLCMVKPVALFCPLVTMLLWRWRTTKFSFVASDLLWIWPSKDSLNKMNKFLSLEHSRERSWLVSLYLLLMQCIRLSISFPWWLSRWKKVLEL